MGESEKTNSRDDAEIEEDGKDIKLERILDVFCFVLFCFVLFFLLLLRQKIGSEQVF